MKEDFEKEVLRASFRDTVEKFEKYFNDPEQCNKISTELGFTHVNNGCDGFCPECGQMLRCEVYTEMKDDWEGIYS